MKSTHERLVEVAYNHFCKNGMVGLTIARLTAEIGKTKGSFYKENFKIKKAHLVTEFIKYGNNEMRKYHSALKTANTLDEYKEEIIGHQQTSEFAKQMILLIVDEVTAPGIQDFNKLLPLSAIEVARILTDDAKMQKRLIAFIGPLAQNFLLNRDGLAFKQRLKIYIDAIRELVP